MLDAIPFWLALGNSSIVSSVITLSVVTFSTLAGYAFAKLRFRGRDGLLVFVIATLAIPTQLGIIPLFMVMRQLGWTGTLGAVIVPMLVTAFGVFFMRQYLVDVIPDELIEAARVDGASMISTFWHVGVPAARPAMAILGLFTFMTAWTDYLWPLLVAPQNPTLQVALSQLQSARYVDYSVVLAGAVLATLPLLILFVIATMAIPTQLGIIPLFMVMRQLGWTGTLGAVIVPTLVTAFGVFFIRQYLVDVIPDELIEAARVDGASMIRTFWHVGVPAARPAMAILGLFTFMTAWTDYLWPLLVVPQNPTLQVALSQLQSARYVDYSVVLAGAVLATLPLLILFIIAGKQLISGIMAGAVKG